MLGCVDQCLHSPACFFIGSRCQLLPLSLLLLGKRASMGQPAEHIVRNALPQTGRPSPIKLQLWRVKAPLLNLLERCLCPSAIGSTTLTDIWFCIAKQLFCLINPPQEEIEPGTVDLISPLVFL